MITVPSGQIATGPFRNMKDPLYGNRIQSFSYHLSGTNGAPKGALVGVTGGNIEFHDNAQIKGGGKITVEQESRSDHNWLDLRIKIVMHIEGMDDTPLGVFIPSVPSESWDDMNLSLDIELLDKTCVLDQDAFAFTHSYPKATNVTAAVRDLILSAGEAAGAITDSDATLGAAMAWEAGTSKLTIINDLLKAADFFALQVDGNGVFHVARQRAPKTRPMTHDFLDDYKSIYVPEFTYDRDIYSIPNKVVLVTNGQGDEEAMTSIATNTNPNSRFSYPSRGRWIVDVLKGVEATSQDALDAMASRRLSQLTSPTGTLTIDHAPLPWVGAGDVVRFRRREADIDVKAFVLSTSINLDPAALQRTQLQEVVDL